MEESEKNIGHGETILLIEDEEMLLDLLEVFLGENGFRILTAKDGLSAVEIFSQHKDEIDLVISDMGLPKLGGWEAFLKMRELQPNLKAILASGYFDPDLKEDLLKAGARDFIQKPYIPELILARIREILDDEMKSSNDRLPSSE